MQSLLNDENDSSLSMLVELIESGIQEPQGDTADQEKSVNKGMRKFLRNHSKLWFPFSKRPSRLDWQDSIGLKA